LCGRWGLLLFLGLYEFPKAVGVKPNADQNEFIAKAVKTEGIIPALRPDKVAQIS